MPPHDTQSAPLGCPGARRAPRTSSAATRPRRSCATATPTWARAATCRPPPDRRPGRAVRGRRPGRGAAARIRGQLHARVHRAARRGHQRRRCACCRPGRHHGARCMRLTCAARATACRWPRLQFVEIRWPTAPRCGCTPPTSTPTPTHGADIARVLLAHSRLGVLVVGDLPRMRWPRQLQPLHDAWATDPGPTATADDAAGCGTAARAQLPAGAGLHAARRPARCRWLPTRGRPGHRLPGRSSAAPGTSWPAGPRLPRSTGPSAPTPPPPPGVRQRPMPRSHATDAAHGPGRPTEPPAAAVNWFVLRATLRQRQGHGQLLRVRPRHGQPLAHAGGRPPAEPCWPRWASACCGRTTDGRDHGHRRRRAPTRPSRFCTHHHAAAARLRVAAAWCCTPCSTRCRQPHAGPAAVAAAGGPAAASAVVVDAFLAWAGRREGPTADARDAERRRPREQAERGRLQALAR
jgi:hypothetical protein